MKKLDWSRLVPVFVLVASVAALTAAFVSQYGFDIQPCVLCLYQRVPYYVAGTAALLAMVLPSGREDRSLIVAVAGLAFLAGAGIAFYHVGVQQHWWASIAACGGGQEPLRVNGPADLMAKLHGPAPKACDEVDWTILGLSMPAYNVVASLALAALSLWSAWRIRGQASS